MRFRILSVLALVATSTIGSAQTNYTWSGGAGSGSWAAAANWDTLPVSGSGSRVILNGTTQTVTTQDFASPVPFVLNRIQMNAGAASGFTVNGGAIQLAGTSPALQTASSGGSLVVNAAVDFAVATALNLNTNYAAGPEMVLNGPLTTSAGAVNLTVNGGIGTGLVLGGANQSHAANLFFATGAQTIVSLGAVNTLTRATAINLTGAATNAFVRAATTTGTGPGFANAGFGQQIGSVHGVADSNDGITSGYLQVGATGGVVSTVLAGFDNTNTSLSADQTSGNPAALNVFGANSHFGKVGTGTFTFGGAGTLGNAADGAGSVSVRDGTMLLQSPNAANGGLQNGANAQADVTVYAGATLRLDNGAVNNSNRLGNTATVVLNGGTLRLDGNATAATSEQMAGMTLSSGQSAVELNAAARGTRFTLVNTIATSPTAAVHFRAANLGEAISTSTSAAANGFQFDTAANATALLVGGDTSGTYSAGATNLGIVRFATTGAAAADTFVTYDAANQSLRRLADTNYAAALGTATDNVSLNAAATVLAATTANALRLTAGGSVLTTAPLTLTSGALLNVGGGNVTGTSPLLFGPGGQSTAYVSATGAVTVSAPIVAANLSKNGAGNLTVGTVDLANATAPRTVAVNAGTLTLAGPVLPGALSPTNTLTYQVSRGATLTAASGLTLGANQVLQGGGTQTTGASSTATVVGNVTVGNGATIRPSSLGGSGPALASPGVLGVTGNVALQPGGTFEWYLNSLQGSNTVGGTTTHYTQSLLNASGSLDLSALSTSNRFNVKVTTLTLSNAPGTVYDYDGGTYSRTIATFTGVTGTFDSNLFNVQYSPSDFGTSVLNLTVGMVGNNLVINFTPVPEPGIVLLAAVAGAVGYRRIRRSFISRTAA